MDRAKSIACLACLIFNACGERPATIVVGSKNFTEQVLLGEIASQQIERRINIKVERKLNLGGTLLAHQALVSGQIDLYPEYTGTALTAILKMSAGANVIEEYRKRWGIEWLQPLGFNNTFAMVVRGDEARRDGIETLSQAAARKIPWKLGVGYEFIQRPDGLAGLMKTYNLPLDGQPKSMDLGLLYKALEQRQVDLVAGNATDGLISAMDLRVLKDDRNYFPAYHAAFLIQTKTLNAHPGLRAALEELSGKLTDQAMRKLNHQIDGEHRNVRDVAKEFLGR